ncbi:unnamed protein product [Blepharisma stoltei]|uniref:Uncharacterized protein n=1 Tax=Blepharisma stoltei TaxID=1481888 RepID=A0AAU9ICJ1_9CILI|nr:unnamed protein product [Blepharisma stoltei]
MKFNSDIIKENKYKIRIIIMIKVHQMSLAIVVAELIALVLSNFEPWDSNYIYLYCSLLASGHLWCLIGKLNSLRNSTKFDSDWCIEVQGPSENKKVEWFPLTPV